MGIKLSNGTIYTKSSNNSSLTTPIVLPVYGQSFADVDMLVPFDTPEKSAIDLTQIINLSALMVDPYNFWGDADGDSNATATETLSVVIKDAENRQVSRNEILNACYAPYTITLTSSEGTLQTQYGSPNKTAFNGDTATYYINPKMDAPYSCWAQPNLDYGSAPNYSDSTYPAWEPTKGFKLQSLTTPSQNFPTMGANSLFFNLTVAGGFWNNINYSQYPENSGVSLKLSEVIGKDNVVKVELIGPKDPDGGSFTPTTFTLYSDLAKTNPIYTFKLEKWFIARPTRISSGQYSDTEAYCTNLFGNYRVSSVAELTNGKATLWYGNLQGWNRGSYQRRISQIVPEKVTSTNPSGVYGGGLFAEWGSTVSSYYGDSDFKRMFFTAIEKNGNTPNLRFYVNPTNGYIDVTYDYNQDGSLCVTP